MPKQYSYILSFDLHIETMVQAIIFDRQRYATNSQTKITHSCVSNERVLNNVVTINLLLKYW